jgi:hypothetical protein
MFATLIDEDWNKKELQFIYQSAIVGQLTNDSFDMYFDTKNGIRTYFNTAPTIAAVRKFFLDECTKLHAMVMACDTSLRNKLNVIRRMSILHAFTLTALDQFRQTEHKYGNVVDWKDIPRKNLVIDMALNKNRFRTVRYMKWLSKVTPEPIEILNSTNMKRKPVNSSALKSVGYNEEKRILEVEILETGRTYQYKDVPLEEYVSFMEAPSLGIYYNKVIKDKYEYDEIFR